MPHSTSTRPGREASPTESGSAIAIERPAASTAAVAGDLRPAASASGINSVTYAASSGELPRSAVTAKASGRPAGSSTPVDPAPRNPSHFAVAAPASAASRSTTRTRSAAGKTTRISPDSLPAPKAAGTAAAKLLRRYRPIETRASGGFGSVEVCVDRILQRRVAIKRIPLAIAEDGRPPQSTKAALAEAKALSFLSNANIVSMIDFAYDSGFAYLVMEYVDGLSLEEFLERVDGSSLTYDECAHLADSLCQALAYAHENGLLHLDIKPANVLIDRSGNIKLADFGMASLSSAGGFGEARGGTIGYMPPEQLECLKVNQRADIFALAAVLYESLCGEAPFRAETPAESLRLIDEGATPPSEYLPDMNEASEEALLAALSADQSRREGTVTEFADRFLTGLGNPRAGRQSFGRLVTDLMADATEEQLESAEERLDAALAGEEGEEPEPVETDWAEGFVGTRHPAVRRVVRGVVAGLSAAVVTQGVFASMLGPVAAGIAESQLAPITLPAALPALVANPVEAPVAAVVSLAVGGAAAAAPQLAVPLVAVELISLAATRTATLPLIAGAALVAALAAGWWLTWGRERGEGASASAGMLTMLGLMAATGAPGLALPVGAMACALQTAPITAGATALAGGVLSLWLRYALAAGGYLGAREAILALANPSYLLLLVGSALIAALVARLLSRAWEAWRDEGSRLPVILACAVPFIAVLALSCLAHPMEIAQGHLPRLLAGAGTAGLSSIIVGTYAHACGYRKEPSEGGRQ